MPLELVPVRCLTDNYAWLLNGNGQTTLIDAPEAAYHWDSAREENRGPWMITSVPPSKTGSQP